MSPERKQETWHINHFHERSSAIITDSVQAAQCGMQEKQLLNKENEYLMDSLTKDYSVTFIK